jgi:hypothetical protein
VAASALALTGCAAEPLPAGPTATEVRHYQQAEARMWWDQMFPNEPMPTVEVVKYSTPQTQDELAAGCIDSALGHPTLTDYSTKAYDVTRWTCYSQYPLDPDGEHQRLSAAQLSYTYSYFNERTVPCLRRLGYAVSLFDAKTLLLSPAQTQVGYPVWSPYWTVLSDPRLTEPALAQVLEACPPPPFDYRWVG